jgi:hypothetical protein
MTIFDSWIELHNSSITDALRHINNELGTSYQHGRFNQWRNGTHLPSARALHLIHNETLQYILKTFEKDEVIRTLIFNHMRLPDSKKV